MEFVSIATLFIGYTLIYAAVARQGRFAAQPWAGVLSDAYEGPPDKISFSGGDGTPGTENVSLGNTIRGKLNSGQRSFARELAGKTGLDAGVIAAWLLAEEPASAPHAPNGAHNWLNIGATDSGFMGAGNPAWRNPVSAADFTADWLRGRTAPGFGRASSGIRGILRAAGQSPDAQIHAIQNSGWASSGYPSLPSIYHSLGHGLRARPRPRPSVHTYSA